MKPQATGGPASTTLTEGLLPTPRSVVLEGPTATYRRSHLSACGPVLRCALRPGQTIAAEGVSYGSALDPGGLAGLEAYRIELRSDAVRLLAGGEVGLLHAGRTLGQLVAAAGRDETDRVHLPTGVIEDWPDFENRGVMLDISRDRVPTMAFLLGWVDRLAGWKWNQLQLYMEHTFAYPGHERVWERASPMTADQIRQLDAYCHDRGIELVPNQNTFGHVERWLKHEPYRRLAETSEPYAMPWGEVRDRPSTLYPADPASLELVDGWLAELLPHFASRQVNLGGDEPWELGQGRSHEACARRGTGRVYLDFLNAVIQRAKSRGHRPMFWGDIVLKHPELIPQLDREAVALNWGYTVGHPFERECPKFAEAGVPFYVCPSTGSFGCIHGRPDASATNLRRAAEQGLAHGAIGLLNTIWGDMGHLQPAATDAVGLTYGAGVAWCGAANAGRDPARTASRFWFGDETGQTGRAWWELGQCRRAIGDLENTPTVLLVSPDSPIVDGQLHRFDSKKHRVGAEAWEAFRAALDRAEATLPAGAESRRDLEIAAGLLRHAADNFEARTAQQAAQDGDLDAVTRDRLAEDLEGWIDAFSAAWREVSRPGGLADAIAPLRRRVENYRRR